MGEFGLAIGDFQEERLEDRQQNGLHHLWSRTWEHAAKIALVVACAQYEDASRFESLVLNGGVVIDEHCARWAIDLVKHIIGRMEREVSMRVADTEFGRLMQMVRLVILKAKESGLTLSQIGRKCLPFKGIPPFQRAALLETLIADEEVIKRELPPASGRGRPREAYIATEYASPAWAHV